MVTIAKPPSHDAFGQITSDSATGVPSLCLFTARPFDTDSDLQNNLNRWYDLGTGRWMSLDPIGFEAGDANLYRYVNNRAGCSLDPSGLRLLEVPIVKRCAGYRKGSPIFSWFSIHGFISIDGVGYGYFSRALTSVGPAEVRDTDLRTYPERDPTTVAHGEFYSWCEPVKLDDCCYKFDCFKTELLRYIAEITASPGTYYAIGNNCWDFIRRGIQRAKMRCRTENYSGVLCDRHLSGP